MAQERIAEDDFVSRETSELLLQLEQLVQKWNPVVNLVSKDSVQHIRDRHIIDSMQLFRLVEFTDGLWADLGSGGGFPGLVVAILMKEKDHKGQICLVEADQRKSAFLREASRQLELPVKIVSARIEDVQPMNASVISARALSDLSQLCGFAKRHMHPDGVALFPKGARHREEIESAKLSWNFDLVVHPSLTNPSAAILEVRNIHHV